MKEASSYNIRYVGFESLADGSRRLSYAITAQGAPAQSASIQIPAAAFSGPSRVTFQESATIGCEKIRHRLENQLEAQVATQSSTSGANASPIGRSHETMALTLTTEDIEQFRPRRRVAGKRP